MSKTIDYSVERTIENVELRHYPSTVLATVHGMADNEAFGILFRYISGNNRPATRLAMTVPVISTGQYLATTPVISDDRSFSFVLPAPYTMENIPLPLDPRSAIVSIPPRRVAAVRFRGTAGVGAVRARTHQLLEVLARHEIRAKGTPFLMRYNAPFTPGLLRRNEVGVEVVSP